MFCQFHCLNVGGPNFIDPTSDNTLLGLGGGRLKRSMYRIPAAGGFKINTPSILSLKHAF